MAGYAKAIAIAAIAVSSALILSLFVVPFMTSPRTGTNSAEARRIVTITEPYSENLDFVNVKPSSNMQPNSAKWIADPFGKGMQAFTDHGINGSATEAQKRAWLADIDAKEKYLLVRLPEWLGVSRDVLESYRLYSALDVASQCNIHYQNIISVIEDSCHGNLFRAWDGLVIRGISTHGISGASGALFSSPIILLPQLQLGTDSEGYIVASKLDNKLDGNGIIGEGRKFTQEQLVESNTNMLQVAGGIAGTSLPFPIKISDSNLVWVVQGNEKWVFPGTSFENHEGAFSALYEPRPMPAKYSGYRTTFFPNQTIADVAQARQIFDELFGKLPGCHPDCEFEETFSGNIVFRVIKSETDLYIESLVWGNVGTIALESVNVSTDETLKAASSLELTR